MKVDTYSLYARIFPAILCALPLMVIWYFVSKNNEVKALGEYLLSINFLKEISVSIVFLYLFSQVIRVASKIFEELYFTKSEGFPTTYLLLYSDETFSSDFKNKFHIHIKNEFDLDLLNESDELNDSGEAKRRITEAINLVRLKIGSGKLVLKHNIWYGFFRNLIGGSVFGMLFSLIGFSLSLMSIENIILFYASIIMFVFYLFIIVFRKIILKQNAEAYARQLITEYKFSN